MLSKRKQSYSNANKLHLYLWTQPLQDELMPSSNPAVGVLTKHSVQHTCLDASSVKCKATHVQILKIIVKITLGTNK